MKLILIIFTLILFSCSCNRNMAKDKKIIVGNGYSYDLVTNTETNLVAKMYFSNNSDSIVQYYKMGVSGEGLEIYDIEKDSFIGSLYYVMDMPSVNVEPGFKDTFTMDVYHYISPSSFTKGKSYKLGFRKNIIAEGIEFKYKKPKDFEDDRLPILNKLKIYNKYGIVLDKMYKESNIDTAFYYLSIDGPKRGKKIRLKNVNITFNYFKKNIETGEIIQKCNVSDIIKIQRVSPELLLAIIPKKQVLTKCSNLIFDKQAIVNFEMRGYYKDEKIIIVENFAEVIFPELLNK